jgi:cytochrome c peroxidase
VPPAPADNPISPAKVELGRHLFYDPRLSGPGNQACASCHQQALAFTDGRPRAVGATGALHPRSAMSLTNVAYREHLGWADPDLDRLEDQALVPLLNQQPVEMGLAGRVPEVMSRLADSALYRTLFARAFPGDPEPIRLENVTRALASFERTLVSGSSPYDRLLFQDDRSALSESALRGMRLFSSDSLRCARCHAGLDFAGAPRRPAAVPPDPLGPLGPALFHNTALYDLDGSGAYPAPNEGLYRATGRSDDMGRFRVPTLRNVAVTAPYMHDGSIATLEQVIAHYASGGRAPGNPRKSPELRGFDIGPGEVADLVAFLESLTDRRFLTDPRFSDPFASSAP